MANTIFLPDLYEKCMDGHRGKVAESADTVPYVYRGRLTMAVSAAMVLTVRLRGSVR